MPLSSYALDTFVSQELSKLTECRATPIAEDFPYYDSWLTTFAATSISKYKIPGDKAALMFVLIRRAEAAIFDYEEARTHLLALMEGKNRISLYFRALRKFESAISMTYQAFDFGRKAASINLFTTGDGSPHERLNLLYNKSKHADPESLPSGHLHIIWITNNGLAADSVELSFNELRNLISEVAGLADKIVKGNVEKS